MGGMSAITVRYLYNTSCPGHEEGLALLRAAALEVGGEMVFEEQEITDDAEAEQLGFYGSPTYLIEGRDPFAPPEGVPRRAEACRAYTTSDGAISPLPDLEQLIAALAEARR